MTTDKKTPEAPGASTKKPASKSTKGTASPKKATKSKAEQKAGKTFKADTPIACKSVRQNQLFFKSNSGTEYVWNGFGDIREIPYGDVMSLKTSRSIYLYEPWLLIEDEDLLAKPEFQKEFGEMYEIYKEFDNPKSFFELPVVDIKKRLEYAPKGLKDLIIYNASKYIEDGTLDRIGVIDALDEMFGTHLRMLI